MKKCLKNSQMTLMRQQLEPLLPQRNKIGYIVARNYRVLSNALIEYDTFKRELIQKYGTVDRDKDGVDLGTISLKLDSPNFQKFCDELSPLNEVEQEVDLMMAKFEDTIGCLNGEEILAIDWMLED